MAVEPTTSYQWASDPSALKIEPSTDQQQYGWSTADNTISGVPVDRPNLQNQNGWQNAVSEWMAWIQSRVESFQIPAGSVIAIDDRITGSYPIPGSGLVDALGFMLCDGSVIPGGNTVSGNVPDLTNNLFLRGSTTAGGTGTGNITLAANNLPDHLHGNGNYASGLTGGPWAAAGHQHNAQGLTTRYSASIGTIQTTGAAQVFIQFGSFNFTSTDAIFDQLNPSLPLVYRQSANTDPKLSSGVVNDTGPASDGGGSSIGGSNSVAGASGSIGSSASFFVEPKYLGLRYLMRVNIV